YFYLDLRNGYFSNSLYAIKDQNQFRIFYMLNPQASCSRPNAIAQDISVYAAWRRVYALPRGDLIYFR
ncbi:MAG: hypothetical protein LBQ29_14935, partial [Acinetobacter sp.]|uniref:hypothetical protein n=1 Tax=Acinetobacter sp. TaxID=472 RepID=UPI0028315D66